MMSIHINLVLINFQVQRYVQGTQVIREIHIVIMDAQDRLQLIVELGNKLETCIWQG